MNNKFSLSNYFHPTPRVWRVIGDTLLALAAGMATIAYYNSRPGWMMATLIIGISGKFITNLFKEEK